MSFRRGVQLSLAMGAIALSTSSAWARDRWTVEEAQAWRKRVGWLVGCNFSPSSAINQLEMWQKATFDPATIDRELAWAESIGFNSIRVFLHNLLWEQDPQGFLERMETFLTISAKHKIGVVFVPLDAVWDPFPKSGPQRAPKPGLHNSGWVQSPGVEILKSPEKWSSLEPYIKGVIGRFRDDKRIHAWDLFNEPDNSNGSSYGKFEPANKAEPALGLLKKVFAWARSAEPSQPLTAGVWLGDWKETMLSPINRYMLEESDVISFHNYAPLPELKERVELLSRYGRPMLCTEYMARPAGSRFDPNLGFLKEYGVGAFNWGFVDGKTQTIYPWDSWKKAYDAPPPVWFHDIFRKDGTPYDPREIEYIKSLTHSPAQ